MILNNIGVWTEVTARRQPDFVAVVDDRTSTTYRELESRAARTAGFLDAEGVGPGDRVAAVLRNRVEFVEFLFGTAKLGAIFAPLNFRLRANELSSLLEDLDPNLIVVERETSREAHLAADRVRTRVVDIDDPSFAHARDASRAHPARRLEAGSPALIQYTSGSTGRAKGAVITHENVMWAATNYVRDWQLRCDDTSLVVNPIFHAVLHILTLPVLYAGGRVLLNREFDAQRALRQIEDERVTVMFAVPTVLEDIARATAFETTDLSSLRLLDSGGAPCPADLIERLVARSLPYRQGYGLTETTGCGAHTAPEDDPAKRGSIGRPFFHVEIDVVGPDGVTVGTDQPGELLMRGRNVCAGYWRRPEETRSAFGEDGWFRTGDLAVRDADGFLFIVDRIKDLIISGGENIVPAEIEAVLREYPLLADVAVVGVPHYRWGETPCAALVANPGTELEPEQVLAFCRERLAGYKCPTVAEVFEALPRTSTGKIAKQVLRHELSDRPLVRALASPEDGRSSG